MMHILHAWLVKQNERKRPRHHTPWCIDFVTRDTMLMYFEDGYNRNDMCVYCFYQQQTTKLASEEIKNIIIIIKKKMLKILFLRRSWMQKFDLIQGG